MTTNPQSPIERLREIAAEQAQLQGRARCTSETVTGRRYSINTDGQYVEWNASEGTKSLPVSDLRAIAREILGMVEPVEVPEPTESKQEPWGYAVVYDDERYDFLRRRAPRTEQVLELAERFNGQVLPLYAAPVKATAWAVKTASGEQLGQLTQEGAEKYRKYLDINFALGAPHRVVGLAEVEG